MTRFQRAIGAVGSAEPCSRIDAAALFPIARGARGWDDAIGDGSVKVYGDPALVSTLENLFLPVDSAQAPMAPAVAVA